MADVVFPGQSAGTINGTAMPVNQDLMIYKGDYLEFLVNINGATGTPLTLTGYTFKAQMKKSYTDTSLPVDFTCAVTGVTGQVKISLSSTAATALVPGSYIWDFQITNAAGQVRTCLTGDVTILPEVTTS